MRYWHLPKRATYGLAGRVSDLRRVLCFWAEATVWAFAAAELGVVPAVGALGVHIVLHGGVAHSLPTVQDRRVSRCGTEGAATGDNSRWLVLGGEVVGVDGPVVGQVAGAANDPVTDGDRHPSLCAVFACL